MNHIELSQLLDGREYREEINPEEKAIARKNGLVILFIHSDDNAEFRGAINDEAGCFGGGTVYLAKDGLFNEDACDCNTCPYKAAAREACKKIEISSSPGYWTFLTEIPHCVFHIYDEGNLFCEGIVFNISSL